MRVRNAASSYYVALVVLLVMRPIHTTNNVPTNVDMGSSEWERECENG